MPRVPPAEPLKPFSLNTEPGVLPAPMLGRLLLKPGIAWHSWFGGPIPDGLPLSAMAAGAPAVATAAEVTRTATAVA